MYERYSKQNYLLNKEKRLEQIKEWQKNNNDKIKKYSKTYYHKNRDTISKKKIKYINII